jgi:hypothetical protein
MLNIRQTTAGNLDRTDLGQSKAPFAIHYALQAL